MRDKRLSVKLIRFRFCAVLGGMSEDLAGVTVLAHLKLQVIVTGSIYP